LIAGAMSLLAVMLGVVTFAVVITLVGMLWSGKLTLPGTDARRVQRADNDARIAQFQLQAAESRRLTAQENLNREIMENEVLEEGSDRVG